MLTLEKWLSVSDLVALSGISQQNVNKAISKNRWRGADLIVRRVEIGRGGVGGMAPQVHVDSLPADLREAWYAKHNIALHEAVDPVTRLRAAIISDGPNTTDAEAISHRDTLGSERIYLVDPWVKVWDTTANAEVIRPASARVAGVIARSDDERGFW